jgi:hypothetical protein
MADTPKPQRRHWSEIPAAEIEEKRQEKVAAGLAEFRRRIGVKRNPKTRSKQWQAEMGVADWELCVRDALLDLCDALGHMEDARRLELLSEVFGTEADHANHRLKRYASLRRRGKTRGLLHDRDPKASGS